MNPNRTPRATQASKDLRNARALFALLVVTAFATLALWVFEADRASDELPSAMARVNAETASAPRDGATDS